VRVTLTSPAGLGIPRTDEATELAEGASAAELLAACTIDPSRCVVVVNGVAATRSTRLRDGDRVRLYPAQAGG
jgi:sulfur carrier protein ThiS